MWLQSSHVPYQSTTTPDSEFTPKSLDSQLSSIHMMEREKNEESTAHVGSKTPPAATPILQAAPSAMDATRLHTSLRFFSLPGNLDSSLTLAEIHKHVSDPALTIKSQRKWLPHLTSLTPADIKQEFWVCLNIHKRRHVFRVLNALLEKNTKTNYCAFHKGKLNKRMVNYWPLCMTKFAM